MVVLAINQNTILLQFILPFVETVKQLPKILSNKKKSTGNRKHFKLLHCFETLLLFTVWVEIKSKVLDKYTVLHKDNILLTSFLCNWQQQVGRLILHFDLTGVWHQGQPYQQRLDFCLELTSIKNAKLLKRNMCYNATHLTIERD